MPGPWIFPEADPGFAEANPMSAGVWYEWYVYDDAGNRQGELTVQQCVNLAPGCAHSEAIFCPIAKHELPWFGCIEEALKCLG